MNKIAKLPIQSYSVSHFNDVQRKLDEVIDWINEHGDVAVSGNILVQKRPQPFTVERTGQFPFTMGSNNYGSNGDQCGLIGQSVLNYRVRAQKEDLDYRGFVVDHADVDRYFQTKWLNFVDTDAPSCELISKRAVEDLYDQYDIVTQVKIWSNPQSGVVFAHEKYVDVNI